MTEPLLAARDGIEAGYGKVQVLWGVEIDVRPRESVVLLGANGAGKTTLLKVMRRADAGMARRGACSTATDVTAMRTDRRVRRGMAYMSELGVFPGLSIEENLRIGGQFAERAGAARAAGGAVRRVPRPRRAQARAGRQPVGRAAQDAGDRQGAGRRARGCW